MPLSTRDFWVFDMDGTLTVAAHDFEAIRLELGLPRDKPILEEIARRPPDVAAALHRQLDEIELAIARRSRPQPGASDVLASLRRAGVQLGILTRNSERIAHVTLEASGLAGFFSESEIVGRESGPPKPRPDGLLALLRRWDATPERAVMIGDYRYDLEAGRNAGTATVHFDAPADAATLAAGVAGEERDWLDLADHRVERLAELLDLRAGSESP